MLLVLLMLLVLFFYMVLYIILFKKYNSLLIQFVFFYIMVYMKLYLLNDYNIIDGVLMIIVKSITIDDVIRRHNIIIIYEIVFTK